ncbi:MAG TPA: crossover junction endodeoxyribonuclease RuvC [Chthoniobacterales bacterium]
MRLLAVDPSLRGTGFAVLEQVSSNKTAALEYGVIVNPVKRRQSGCLVAIYERLSDVIAKHQPEACAVEGVIYVQSLRTAITLGAARGAAILAISRHGIPIFEYAPRKVKQAVVGSGSADKQQVAFMIRAMLGLTETPPPDAADALAIGLTHFQARASLIARKMEAETI